MVRFKNGEPQAVWFSQHDFGEAYTYSAVQKVGKRPVAFSARGSHANYATANAHDLHNFSSSPFPPFPPFHPLTPPRRRRTRAHSIRPHFTRPSLGPHLISKLLYLLTYNSKIHSSPPKYTCKLSLFRREVGG